MSRDTYEILALKYGEFTQRRRYESFIAADDHDAPHPIDYFVWVVRNSSRTIVVDTGFDAVEGAKRGRKVMRAPAAALEQIGVAAGNLEQVVITHLHYDHAGTLGAFPKARFHLQAAEMAYATGPCMCHAHLRHPFTAEHVCDMVKNVYSGRVVFHDGDTEIAPGISLHKLGGHSRGLQCVRVATATGPVVLASDASHFYENFEKGKVFPITIDIADVLEMTVREAFTFFRGQKKAQTKLKRLMDVGLDYIRLGQPANTLSGGEAQRLKLAGYLSAKRRGRCLFLLDEPTTGLHFSDIVQLLDCFTALLDAGHSLIVVEHNLAVIRAADHVIDLGPEAAEGGGRIVATGTPEAVSRVKESITGRYLAAALAHDEAQRARVIDT